MVTVPEHHQTAFAPVQDLSRFQLPEGFRGRGPVTCQLWWIVQDTIFAMSPQFMYGFRNSLLRLFGAKVGRNVIVRPTVKVTFPWKLTIGDNAWIGDNAQLYTLGPIVIGDNAVVSQLCYLCTGSHDPAQIDFPIYAKTITIEPEAWLCADVFVMPGVTIGRGAVIGARSLVTGDVPPLALAKGHPARVVGQRPRKPGTLVVNA